MVPKIHSTSFGSITIGDQTYQFDVVIRLNGMIIKRKKKLSKEVYGTSHILSHNEAKFVYEKTARTLIIGSGQSGMMKLSDEAVSFLEEKKCKVKLLSTPDAINVWNETEGKTIGLFHVTC